MPNPQLGLLIELKQLLLCHNVTDRKQRGVLILAGFLGLSELQDNIQTCWENSSDKAETLSEALWAMLCCNNTQSWHCLDKLLQYWDSLSFDSNSDKDRRKPNATVGIISALAFSHCNDVIVYLTVETRRYKSLCPYISCILRTVDSPDALEFIVREAADIPVKDHPQSFFRQICFLADSWNPAFPDSRKLSHASMERLKILWEESKNDSFLRRIAFHIWEMGISQSEIKILWKILPDSPLYRQALWNRVKLGDFSTVADLALLISTNDGNWLSIAHFVWCPEIMKTVRDYLETLEISTPKEFSDSSSYEQRKISKLLTVIPKYDAEELLNEHWKFLGYCSLFVQTAFYIGTPRCLELAKTSLSQASGHVSMFKGLCYHFYLRDENREKYISTKQLQNLLQNLLPYLDRFDDFDLWQLADTCKKFGVSKWSSQYLAPKLSDEFRKRCHPTVNDLLEDLKNFLSGEKRIQRLTFWLEVLERKYELNSNIISNFISSHPTIDGLRVADMCLRSIGVREDVSILDNVRIATSIDEARRIKTSTQFAICRRTLD